MMGIYTHNYFLKDYSFIYPNKQIVSKIMLAHSSRVIYPEYKLA